MKSCLFDKIVVTAHLNRNDDDKKAAWPNILRFVYLSDTR